MRLITLALLLVAALGAQTKAKLVTQIEMPPVTETSILGAIIGGKPTIITIDSTLKLAQNGSGGWVLSAVIPSWVQAEEKAVPLTRAADGSYALPDVTFKALKVFRNGALQSLVGNPNGTGVSDYMLTGNIIRGTASAAWQPDDSVIAVYLK